MSRIKAIKSLSLIITILTLIVSSIGLFYTTGGQPFVVQNIYGASVTLYGDGIYAYNSILKVGTSKGTDIVMILVALLFGVTTFLFNKGSRVKLIHTGLLAGLLYYSTCLAFGVTYNRIFILYLLLFSATLFLFIMELKYIFTEIKLPEKAAGRSLKGTGIFLIVAGCSVLVWLMFIIPTIITGAPMEIIEIYTTEPTFVIDLGVILPSAVYCGILLLNRNSYGYRLVPVILIPLTIVGLCVIGQTIMQTQLGIVLPLGQLIGLVVSFVILGIISVVLNVKFLKHIV